MIGPVINPTGNMAADLKPAFAFFRTLVPKHPERADFPEWELASGREPD